MLVNFCSMIESILNLFIFTDIFFFFVFFLLPSGFTSFQLQHDASSTITCCPDFTTVLRFSIKTYVAWQSDVDPCTTMSILPAETLVNTYIICCNEVVLTVLVEFMDKVVQKHPHILLGCITFGQHLSRLKGPANHGE
jgi:hypothetical protein